MKKIFSNDSEFTLDILKDYLDFVGSIIVGLDIAGKVIFVNNRACEVLEGQKDEIIGKNWVENFIPPELNKSIEGVRKDLITSDEDSSPSYENPIITRTGKLLYIKWTNTILKDKNGEFIGTLSSGEDLTEIRQNEFNLLDSEKRLKDSESMSHTGHWVRDLKTANYIFSDELYRIFGLSKKIKLISADLLHERFHPDDAARIIEYTERCLIEGKDYNFEGRLLMPDNAIKYIKASVKISKNDTGVPILAKGIMSDVTEAALYEQKLIRNEMQLRAAENIAKVGNWVQDLETNKYVCSNGFLKICGIEAFGDGADYNEVIGVTHPDDIDYIESIIADSLKSGSDYEFENRIIRPNGEIRYVRSKGTYIKDASGKPVKSMGTLLDITEYKENENRLLEIQNRLIRAESIAHIGHWERNYITGKSYWSDEVYKMIGVKAQSFVASEAKFAAFIHPDDIAKFTKDNAKAIKGEMPYDIESRIIHSNGEVKYIRIIGDIILNGGELVKTFGAIEDITSAKLHEAELIKKNRTLEDAEAIAHVGHFVSNVTTGDRYWSDELFRLFGYEPQCNVEKSYILKASMTGDDYTVFFDGFIAATKTKAKLYEADIKINDKQDNIKFLKIIYNLKYKDEKHVKSLGIVQDMTSVKKHYEDFEYLNYHDSLTDLFNRRAFDEKFMKLDNKSNYPLSVIIADINGLKMINDTAGQSTGDRILMKTARILKSVCQNDDFLARISGDDFILILPRTVKSQAQMIINDLHDLFYKTNAEVPFSVSIGLAVKTVEDKKKEDIIKEAEDNMYSNKLYEKSSKRGDMLRLIMDALYERSSREEMHSERVSKYCEEIGIALKMQKHKINELSALGLLHDIGKIAVKDSILNKPGKLDEDEWKEIKRHPETGYRILSNAPGMQEASNYILLHHERWDGKGYPKGLSTYDIPLQARIIAIGDAFDAMRSKRPYRESLSLDTAVAEIIKGAGTQFDPELAKVFVVEVLGKEWS